MRSELMQLEKDLSAAQLAEQTKSATGATSLIDELEKATQEASHERRVQMLRKVTDLFVDNADKINQDKANFFGDVLDQFISCVEQQALSELSVRIAPLENTPKRIIQSLARNDEIAVAGPVLARSPQLNDFDLIEIAKTKSQKHLGSISERQRIATAVTDILVERGNSEVLRKVSRNQGAFFSNFGLQQLTSHAASDEALAETLVQRPDLPNEVLKELISRATETVRTRMLASARANDRGAILAAIANASVKLLRETISPRDFSQAKISIAKLIKDDQLNESAVLKFANAKQYEKLVVSLAHLSSAPIALIDQLMGDTRHEGILVACKAASLHWSTLRAILINRFTRRQLSEEELERARFNFVKLTAATARRAFRFWVIRGASKVPAENQ